MSKKVKRSVAVVLCLVFCFALLGCGSGTSGGAADAIKEYFDACNDMDMAAIHAASFPEGMNGRYSERLLQEGDYNFYKCWREDLGFVRSKYDMADWAKFDPNFIVFKDFPNGYEGENGDLQTKDGERLTLEEAFPDFSVEYTIEELEHFSDCRVCLRDGLSLVDLEDMDQIVQLDDSSFLDVDDMYVAQLKVEWAYEDKPYGYNRHWWKDENFLKSPVFSSYEDAVSDLEDIEYYVFVYKYNDEWYVYPETWNKAAFLYKVEF